MDSDKKEIPYDNYDYGAKEPVELKIKDMTCILITHRIENMKYFDRVIQIKDKKLIEN